MRFHKSPRWLFVAAVLALGLCAAGYSLYNNGRPPPLPVERQLGEGVTYRRIARFLPRPMIIHLLTIDTRAKGLYFFVTPPDDPDAEMPLRARTTSQFLLEFDAQLAINGDGFSPWWSNSPADYYPHVGDPVTPNGYTASYGEVYARPDDGDDPRPVMYISRRNSITFNRIPGKVFHALSGDRMLVEGGKLVPDLDNADLDPRTAIGVNKSGRWVYIVVVDGRQPFYSEGITLHELGNLLRDLGAQYAMNLDGGGSTTLVMLDDGAPVSLNSPIDSYIPGRERPVANHLGIRLRK